MTRRPSRKRGRWGPKELAAIARLIFKKYWGRVWMVLELTAPERDPLVGCGHRWVSLSAFREMMVELEVGLPLPDSCRAWMMQLRIRMEYQARRELNLITILRLASAFYATDQRDKIHALLGLASEDPEDHRARAVPSGGAAARSDEHRRSERARAHATAPCAATHSMTK